MNPKNIFQKLSIAILLLSLNACGFYSFTGGDVGDAKTLRIGFFTNEAALVQPGIDQRFTLALQDLFLRQTNLSLTSSESDLTFEGSIVAYDISPVTATAEQTAAQSRLTIQVSVQFYNKLDEEKNFDKRFSHFFDFDASQQLVGGTLDEALKVIYQRITQDIFNAALANW